MLKGSFKNERRLGILRIQYKLHKKDIYNCLYSLMFDKDMQIYKLYVHRLNGKIY